MEFDGFLIVLDDAEALKLYGFEMDFTFIRGYSGLIHNQRVMEANHAGLV